MTTQEEELLRRLVSELKERTRATYESDLRAIERVERMLLAPAASVRPSLESLLNAAGSDTPPPDREEQEDSTLIDSVERAFRAFPDRSWNVATLENHLRSNGFTFAAKNPRSSLNTTLTKLVKRHVVRVSKKGVGRKPNLYRWVVPAENNGAHVEADA